MGLPAHKRKKLKLAADPMNSGWEAVYGHRILQAQGWAPGETLGPKDAAHAAHHTAASAKPLRVSLKDDTLGLGARAAHVRGPEESAAALGGLADVLGRLNGKNDAQVQQEREERDALQRRMYVRTKFGQMTFIRGGFLVGDRVEEKRPVGIDGGDECDESSRSRQENENEDRVAIETQTQTRTQAQRKHSSNRDRDSTPEETDLVAVGDQALRKAARKQRNEDRRRRREARRLARGVNADSEATQGSEKREETDDQHRDRSPTTPTSAVTVTNPTDVALVMAAPEASSGSSTPQQSSSRYLGRRKKIARSEQALREILMATS